MYQGKKILGLIPARAGSKGIPGKNIRLLAGKPLIAWTIGQALNASYLDKVIVSTDSEEIAEISRRFGAETPFLRPGEIAGDAAKRIDTVFHALDWLGKNNTYFDAVMLLQPTSPLRTNEDINGAVEYMINRQVSAVISVCKDTHPPFWSNSLPEDRCMKDFLPSHVLGKNRQELGTYYRLTGAIFIAYVDYLCQNREFLGPQTYAYEIPAERSIDIDNLLEWEVAELLLQKKQMRERL